MIAVSSLASGKRIRVLSASQAEGDFGFHTTFGFVSRRASESRTKARAKSGLRTEGDWLCEFRREARGFRAISGCQIQARSERDWELRSSFGDFLLSDLADGADPAGLDLAARGGKPLAASQDRKALQKALAIAFGLLLVTYAVLPRTSEIIAPPPFIEPVEVKMVQETQKAIKVPALNALPKDLAKEMTNKAKVAVAQNLGFLALSGRKDLTKALGGMPTVPTASAGAGAGGKEGSGGELLVGLGQGVQRTTVGNSGVAGLGGIGTKGAGGGGGGYGTSLVGSGGGRALSSIPLSQDMILEGGLDRSVIQATIAKYLNQVRACYEEGLRKTPGLVGQVTMSFVIGGGGSVDKAQVAQSSLGSPEVEGCITARLGKWIFPKPRGGMSVKVNYPFLLRPVKS